MFSGLQLWLQEYFSISSDIFWSKSSGRTNSFTGWVTLCVSKEATVCSGALYSGGGSVVDSEAVTLSEVTNVCIVISLLREPSVTCLSTVIFEQPLNMLSATTAATAAQNILKIFN